VQGLGPNRLGHKGRFKQKNGDGTPNAVPNHRPVGKRETRVYILLKGEKILFETFRGKPPVPTGGKKYYGQKKRRPASTKSFGKFLVSGGKGGEGCLM